MFPAGAQLSVAVAVPVPDGVLSSSQLTVTSAGQVITGAVLSSIVIICVNTSLVLPQPSVTVHVLVYVPSWGLPSGIKIPESFTMSVTSPSQLSVATGNSACAAVMPAASLHSNVVFSAPAIVVHTGSVLSVMVI